MGEGESTSKGSLELLSNTAAWKNAVEKKMMIQRVSSPPTTGGTPTEVLITISPQTQPGSLVGANNFARSTSTLSLAGQGGGGDQSTASSVVATTKNNNVVTTASSVSSFDGDSAYSTSPKTTSTGLGLSLESSVPSLPTDAAAAYRAAMMGILAPNGGISTSSSPQQQPVSIAAARFSSTIGEQQPKPLSLSLPMLGSNTAAANAATMKDATPATAFLLEQKSRLYSNLASQGGSNGSHNNSTASLLSEANLILSANMLSNTNGTPAPSPQASKTMQENKQAEPMSNNNNQLMLITMAQENKVLKESLSVKDKELLKLRKEMSDLKTQIQELRQLPTGKISQIPVEDMIEMMQTYGSEVSDSVMPIRKNHIQKASIVRQFRRWNPNFLEHFHHVNGKWAPKLGRDGELKRRRQARLERKSSSSSSSTGAAAGAEAATAVTTTNNNMSMTGAATSAAAPSSKSSTKAATVFPSANKVTRKKAKKGLA